MRRIFWLSLAALIAVDAARSINARLGYREPEEAWKPAHNLYASISWPPGQDTPSTASAGARVYAERCAICHGPDGKGNGPAAPSLIPRPRDFTLGLFKYKSTPFGSLPTTADLEAVIADGLPASAMPYFKDLLSADQIHAVADHVRGFVSSSSNASSSGAATAQPALTASPVSIPTPPGTSPASIERGRALYGLQGCAGCHGPDGRKGGFIEDAKGYPTPIRDLTAPWTFHGGSAPARVWLRLTTGLAGSSMPSYANALTDGERWDLVSFVESLARVPPWERGGRFAGRGLQADLVRRGEYIVHAEMCGLCHTQIDPSGIYRADDFYLAGGMRVGAYPQGFMITRNLTSDRETGLGGWSEAQIVAAFRTGRAPARLLNLWGMPWFYVHYLTDDDATAVARYLKSDLPAVRNRIPLPVRYGIAESAVMKLTRPLPAVNPVFLTYADGNFGRPDSRQRADWTERVLIDVQWVVLAIAALAFIAGWMARSRS
ncbi:MAG TPA: c-type cytochrome, partial [Vicinamibacterales bacterium]|nr:c-type cytochrome [Vicinamibacterales bacterium]